MSEDFSNTAGKEPNLAHIFFFVILKMPVRLSVRMEQLGSHWGDFHEILYLNIFQKSLEKIQVSLKSDKNNGYFT
jgi:hypothetical protein